MSAPQRYLDDSITDSDAPFGSLVSMAASSDRPDEAERFSSAFPPIETVYVPVVAENEAFALLCTLERLSMRRDTSSPLGYLGRSAPPSAMPERVADTLSRHGQPALVVPDAQLRVCRELDAAALAYHADPANAFWD